jgi:hypothetical protein
MTDNDRKCEEIGLIYNEDLKNVKKEENCILIKKNKKIVKKKNNFTFYEICFLIVLYLTLCAFMS